MDAHLDRGHHAVSTDLPEPGQQIALEVPQLGRPSRLLDPRLCPLRNPPQIDIDVFRENTEGVYVNMGGHFKRGTPDEVAVQEDVNTYKGVERIVRAAFEHALRRGGARVTMVDKANKALAVNWDDELGKATALTKDGAVIHPNFQPKA